MVPDSVLFCIVFTRVWGFQTVVLSPLTNLVHTCCLNLKDRHCTAVRLCSAFSNTVSWVLYVHFFFYSILALSGVTVVLVLFSWARWSSFSNLEVSLWGNEGHRTAFFLVLFFSLVLLSEVVLVPQTSWPTRLALQCLLTGRVQTSPWNTTAGGEGSAQRQCFLVAGSRVMTWILTVWVSTINTHFPVWTWSTFVASFDRKMTHWNETHLRSTSF